MEKKKVLQINKFYYPHTGGIERVVQQIAEGLKDRTDMEVLVCRDKGLSKKEIVNGVRIYRAGSLGVLFKVPISFPFLWKIRKLSKEKDILHFHMPFPLGDLGCLLSGFRGKVVVWWHSDVVRQKTMMKFYRPIMERFLQRADVIIVASQGHIDGSDYLPKYKDKCVVIPFGVEPMIEAKADSYINQKQEMFYSNSNKVKFLFVGRLVYYKGCDILLHAFQKVEGAELTIIGSGDLEQELKEAVYKSGMQDRVHFLGSVDEERLSKAFADCDVFVLPSVAKSEAFGLVQIEAMAYGKPVINTNLPSGVPYVSVDGITGLTVPPADVDALTKAMQWMVVHDSERREMGIKARERVKECYQMQEMLDKIYAIYCN